MLIVLMGFMFLFLGYMGVPVAFALIGSVLLVTAFTPISHASMIAQIFNGMDVEALMAVPFFLLVGDLMTSANVTARMIALSQTLVGHLRGGLAQVVTIFSMFFAGISGSSAADVAVLSRSIAPEMNREGYDRAFTAALIASAATMANLIPPSIMAVVYGATGNVSIGGLFLAGVVPGVLVGIGLMIYSHFFGPVGLKRQRATFGQFSTAAKEAAIPLMIPIIIMGGILTGMFTPTEAGIIAVAYIVFIAIPMLNLRHLPPPAARHGDDRPALLDPAHHHRRGFGVRLDAGLSARAGGGVGMDRACRRRRSLHDHAAAGAAVHHRRRLHRRRSRPSSSSCR